MSHHVLLIDDEPDFTELTSTLLAFHGMHTMCVNAPERAEAAIREAMPDIIVTDLMMPRLDGIHLATQVRAMPGGAQVPILMLTAKILSDEERRRLLDANVVLLTKPFEPHRLVAQIQELLDARPA